MIPYMAQTHYALSSQVLTKFFSSATILAMLLGSEVTDSILHSMVGYRFRCIS